MTDQLISNVSSLRPGSRIQSPSNFFQILQPLGSGGNGKAYLVLCTDGPLCGNFFTLKFLIRIEADRQQRFFEEIKFIRDNKHPSILAHYDEGLYQDKIPFVVTEYLRHCLSDVLKQLDLQECLVYAVQLLSAVNYLQLNNFVHRDIKPQNVLLDNSNAILSDFGLIKKIGSDDLISASEEAYLKDAMPLNYRTPQLMRYMNGGELSLKSDVFQLGLLFHEIFTGEQLLKQASNKKAPLVEQSFKPFGHVRSEKYGARIMGLIKRMVSLEENEIPDTKMLLGSFQDILTEYFVDYKAIHFRIQL